MKPFRWNAEKNETLTSEGVFRSRASWLPSNPAGYWTSWPTRTSRNIQHELGTDHGYGTFPDKTQSCAQGGGYREVPGTLWAVNSMGTCSEKPPSDCMTNRISSSEIFP